jgi:hypothetical protein
MAHYPKSAPVARSRVADRWPGPSCQVSITPMVGGRGEVASKPPSGPGPQARCAWSGEEGPGIPRWMTRSETPWENYTMLRSWVVADCVARVPSLKAQFAES